MRRFIYLFIIATLVFSCDKLELLEHSNPLDVSGAGEPLVITEGNSNITSTSVTLFGQIEDIGHALVTQHGHCWSISSSPTLNDSKTSLGAIGVASFTLNGNLVVFSASSGDQSSLPFEAEKHGIFTYYLLKAIQDANGDISYGDLFDAIKLEVNRTSIRNQGMEQTPQVNTSKSVNDSWKTWKL